MSKTRLRQAVLRDLAWLFNTTRVEANVDLSHAPYVRQSVLNFGLPALSGRSATSSDVADRPESAGNPKLSTDCRT